jgi:hypothetical protein
LGSRLACTFGSFDKHGQLSDHRNRISFHIDLPMLLKQRSLTNGSSRARPSERPGIVRILR